MTVVANEDDYTLVSLKVAPDVRTVYKYVSDTVIITSIIYEADSPLGICTMQTNSGELQLLHLCRWCDGRRVIKQLL